MLRAAMQMAIPCFSHSVHDQDRLRQLLRDARRGDAAAFETLVELHERLVLRFAQRLVLNREAARDASQEVFLRLYRNLNSVDERRDLKPWLYRTTANVCFDLLRKTKSELPIDVVSEPATERKNPEEMAALVQRQRLVLAGLQALTPRERQAIVLRDLEGHSTSEVAEILGSSEATVRSQISTGRIKLRDFLAKQMGDRQ